MAEAIDRQDSRLLFHLCCDAGFSEEQWDKRLQLNDAMNTVESYRSILPGANRCKALYSGSTSEGVAMDFLGSDIDIMFILSYTQVIEDDDISPNESDNVFKMISTNHPAFVNTELRHRGETDCLGIVNTAIFCEPTPEGRLLLNGEMLKALFFRPGFIPHGPAQTRLMSGPNLEIDNVYSLHCRRWPSVSREWRDRPREYNWPTPEQIKEIVDNGCELVSVGAPNSASPQFDFRLSSSMAEQILVRSFNIYQIQCYFLLKVILKFCIKPCLPIETLCSYHMKTIMLYVVETTNPVIWREDNLVYCFMICLQKLQTFLRDGYCPQYFIPQQNLFERKVKPQLNKVIEVVNDIVADGWRCVLRCPAILVKLEDGNKWEWERNIPLAYIPGLTLMLDNTINDMCDVSLHSWIDLLQHMRSSEVENESKYFPCKETVLANRSLLKSTIGLSLLNKVTRREDRDHVERIVLQYAKQCMESACESSLVSCRLKYALFLYVNKETERCVELVKECVTTQLNRDVLNLTDDVDRAIKSGSIPPRVGDILNRMRFNVRDVRDAYARFIPPVNLSKWEVKACPLIIQKVAETRPLDTSYDHKHHSVLMIDYAVFADLLLVLAYTDLGRFPESRQYLELLRQCAENHNQCFIFYPNIARLLLEQCQQYVSSGIQQDVSASN